MNAKPKGYNCDGVKRLLLAVVLQAAEDVCRVRRMGVVIAEDGSLVGEWPVRRGKGTEGDNQGGGDNVTRGEAVALGRWIVKGYARRWLELAEMELSEGADVEGCLLGAGLAGARGGWDRWIRGL